MENLIDGMNRSVSADNLRSTFSVTKDAYRYAKAGDRLSLSVKKKNESAAWLLSHIKK